MDKIWSVTQLNTYIQGLLEAAPRLTDLWVQGEISNFKHHTSGHMYFTLKDRESVVKAVMFRGKNRCLSFRPENGLKVILRGQVSVYPRDGIYQIYAEEMEPAGLGGIFLALEQVKQRLAADGLFAAERKRPLPLLPRKVGIVTAPTGAAIRDLFSVLQRRFPTMNIAFAPAVVQGEEAVPSLIRALQRIVRVPGVDVVIIGRGGGSREDLWAFNDEALCRAIAACPVPVVSAVGHESDVSLTDLVADMRAATPSAAAELVVPLYSALHGRVDDLALQLQRAMTVRLARERRALSALAGRPSLDNPLLRLRAPRQRVDQFEERLRRAVSLSRAAQLRRRLKELEGRLLSASSPQRLCPRRERIEDLKHRLIALSEKGLHGRRRELAMQAGLLDALSPLAVLDRGFALCLDSAGQVLRDSAAVAEGERVDIVLQRGELTCRVEERRENRRWQREKQT
ncbi:exodeoxyribonuclease vii, large subunit [Heliomicrobium modesticaldum Ice1]|uniref:Exodeoxyribonuclease 7 large subunit n=1 Tax=Heliobacterium modesticaldum (strain ATCC 51547 / Ice1) TaxID=498761 RepID=B0TEJ1_HELMI|nr:exodeoxyribonuclease VII large subunit [Heliomicrobium modesticaldum]ABZ82910.1 exodeoxyribonuclease vii, large subunit [Heliomicrobium modesticaldum Ice1]